MNNWLNRTEYLIGIDNISKLKNLMLQYLAVVVSVLM